MARRPVQITPGVLNEVRAYRQVLRRARIPVRRLIIFGSRAKGTARPDSDIDVAVVSPALGKDSFRERVRLSRLRGDLLRIEPHPFHPDDLKNRWSTLVAEIKKHGIPVDE